MNRNVLSLITTSRTSSYSMRRRCEARSLWVRLEMRKSELEDLQSICGHGPGSVVDLWCWGVGLWQTLNMGLVNLGLSFSLNLEILAKICGIYLIFLDWWYNIHCDWKPNRMLEFRNNVICVDLKLLNYISVWLSRNCKKRIRMKFCLVSKKLQETKIIIVRK